ncbi:MAG: tRNA uridine-5-carboxymethylaminomethyl(34) synthesis GTPase MnmE [Clostridia bacterium]|nr:tRNA uridine-5-carboxymethylaminomethyl(34) synthesis GTPase MnmE [Clostridia bacterium]
MQLITAISTPIGMGAISIVRVSGEGCLPLVERFFHTRAYTHEPTPNVMYLGRFVGEGFSEQCMMVYFKAPRSYTGEDMVEVQVHGGVTVTNLVLRTFIEAGARLAAPGEFTRRAFLNGKLSLSAAEGVLGVIEAESAAELAAAGALMQGSLAARLAPSLSKLEVLLASVEASLDYPDEMQEELDGNFAPLLAEVLADLSALAATAGDGKLARHGISVAIVGSPNAGKSSLLNAILHEDRAIVTEIAGTTRDTLCESVTVGGVRLNLLDTAGLRQTEDVVESIGVERAYAAADKADAVVYVLDGDQEPDPQLLARVEGKHLFVVRNKSDLGTQKRDYPTVSAKLGLGIDSLLADLAALVNTTHAVGGMLVEDRHVQAVSRALAHLRTAREAYETMPLDAVALSLRQAYSALGEIDGATATDQIIDGIFSRFCVGK